MKPRKDLGFDEESDKAGEEDEDESDGEETGKKSFFWENFANSHFQGLPHSQSGRDERGVEGDPQQIALWSKMIESSFVALRFTEEHLLGEGHGEGGKGSLEEDFRLTEFLLKPPPLCNSSPWIPPHLPDDVGRPQLRVNVEQAGKPGDLLPLVDPVPGEPRCQVVQEEGDK